MDPEFARHSNATVNLRSTSYWMFGRTPEFAELAEGILRVFDPFELDERFMLDERDIILREHDFRVVEDPYAPLHDDLMRRLHGDGRSLDPFWDAPRTLRPSRSPRHERFTARRTGPTIRS